MNFEVPGLLWGMLAGLIPVLIHLIQRKRAKVHEFAAMEFLLGMNKAVARRYRLRELLLLALRVLLIAAIPFSFAKPFLTSDVAASPGSGTPTSVVIVIDPSASMSARLDGEALLDRAVDRARALIGDLRADSDAAIVLAESPAKALTTRLTYDRTLLQSVLGSIVPSAGRADLAGALRIAEQILVEASHERREVAVFTDLQATEWEGLGRPWSLERTPRVSLIDVRDGDAPENAAVTKVVAEPVPGMPRDVRVDVTIRNDRRTNLEDVVTVNLGTRSAKSALKLGAGETVTKTFTLRLPESGLAAGTAEIGPDELLLDNSRTFVVDVGRRISVLVVNGAPRGVPHRDETFFLKAALQPGRDVPSRTVATIIRSDELGPAQLATSHVVVLANVEGLDDAQVKALRSFVESGGGLFISGGDNVTADGWSGALGELSPLPIRGIQDVSREPVHIGTVNTQHPMLTAFDAIPDASLFSARVKKYLLLAPSPEAKTTVLAAYTDGSPALVERLLGQGRVVLFTTTLDRDFTDLPFKTSYLPFVQQIVEYLGSRLEGPRSRDLVVGEAQAIPATDGVRQVEVTRPDGHTFRFEGADLAGGDLRFRDTRLVGIYRVTQRRNAPADGDGAAGAGTASPERLDSAFAVGLDPRESALLAADPEALARSLAGAEAHAGAEAGDARPLRSADERKSDLWPLVLAALLFVLVFETWLGFRRSQDAEA
ncbi:MAG: BatA domain-containing protein [Myxococcales bacterium]|nr:BatA domain-containing protein [Myxococcales bacterium]